MMKRLALSLAFLTLALAGCGGGGGGGNSTAGGSINVSSTPDGARIYLDAADTGKITPAILTAIPEGDHIVRLVLAGYEIYEQSVRVYADQTASVTTTLTPTTGGVTGIIR